MKILTFLFAILISTSHLTELIDEMNTFLQDIEYEKEIISQRVDYNQDKPFNVELTRITKKIKDNKEKTETFRFNLALLDRGSTEIKASKKEMKIIAKLERGKFIQKWENDEAKGYTDKIEIFCQDIDEARDLKEILDQAITAALADWEASIQVPEDLPTLKPWVMNYIGTVSNGKKIYLQELSEAPDLADYVNLYCEEEGKSDESSTYYFSLADVDISKLQVKPSGDAVRIKLESNSHKKTFKKEQKEEGVTFEDDLELWFSDATAALEFAKGLEKAFALTKSIYSERKDNYKSCENCLDTLITEVNNYNSPVINQKIKEGCQTVLLLQEDGEDAITYDLAWGDFDPKNIDVDYNSSELQITLKTVDKKKFVLVRKKDKIDYSNKIEFYFSDVESVWKAEAAIPKVIENCPLDSKPQNVQWLTSKVSDESALEKYSQTLVSEESSNCEMTLTKTEKGKDKMESFNFNLYDLNPQKIDLSISSKELSLQLQTNDKEKIITVTDEKGKIEYTDKIDILFSSLEDLRIAALTMKELINECEE